MHAKCQLSRFNNNKKYPNVADPLKISKANSNCTLWLNKIWMYCLRTVQNDLQKGRFWGQMLEGKRCQPGTDNFLLSVCCCGWFLASLGYQEHSYSNGGVNCLQSVLYRCNTYVLIDHRHWFHWTLELHVSLVDVSLCSNDC